MLELSKYFLFTRYAEILMTCWDSAPGKRPNFSEIISILASFLQSSVVEVRNQQAFKKFYSQFFA